MASGVTGNEKKFKAHVADFVTATAELGDTIDPQVVAVELRQRIQFIASQIGVTEATVLRTYMDDDWGRDMARQTYRQIQERDAYIHAEPDQQLPLTAVGRLVAALGQAQLYYTVNNAATDHTCTFNPKEASEAITGLGVVLTSHRNDGSTVTVAGNVLAWTKAALTVFRDNLQRQRWTSCPLRGGLRPTPARCRRTARTPRRPSAPATRHLGVIQKQSDRDVVIGGAASMLR